MKKVLYLYSDAGGCHRVAADAIADAVDHRYPGRFEHRIVDMWSLGSKLQERLFGEEAYRKALERYPSLYGLTFWLSNNMPVSSLLVNINYPSLGRGLRSAIRSERPDMIVSVHPLANAMLIRSLRDLNLHGVVPTLNCELELVTVHHFWVDKGFDHNVVPTEEARSLLLKRGIRPGKIDHVGFPLRRGFLRKFPDKPVLRKRLGLREELFTIQIMGGVEGVGDIVGLVNELGKVKAGIQVLVCTGKNKGLYDELKRLKVPFPLSVHSYTDKIPEMMRASDLILTKAGAASIFEAVASGLPMIIYSYVPGQEAGTPGWVERKGFGKFVRGPGAIVGTINDWIGSGRINEIRDNISSFRDFSATFEIADLINRVTS